MKKSALQIARAAYQPKLPVALTGNVKVVEGAPTQSVADQESKSSFQTPTDFPKYVLKKATLRYKANLSMSA